MERIPLSPPVIPKLTDNSNRPLWSVMIPAYNCSIFLKEAIESVLQQDLGTQHMQIEVVDDCSTDADVAALVAQVGKGRVSYYRQSTNVGSLRNFETCINRARGFYVHLLHGDDRVKNGFYNEIDSLFQQFKEAGAAFCAFDVIKQNGQLLGQSDKQAEQAGILNNWLHRIAAEPRLQYCCMVVKREVYEHLGSFYLTFYGEDWEMWTRIAKSYAVAYSPKYLAEYRVQNNSITSRSFLTGDNVRDIAKVIEKNIAHLPEQDRENIKSAAKKYYAYDAVKKSLNLWHRGKSKNAVKIQLTEALKMYSDSQLKRNVLKMKLLMLLPTGSIIAIRKLLRRG